MYLECRGAGSPLVVLVAGLKGSADDWDVAEKPGPTYPQVAKFTRVCAYDRPGTPVGEKPSRSDPVPQPTTTADAVADLHAMLAASGEQGPYVLAGHSYGGLIARLYASDHPGEVAGMVLVDALTEGLRDAETQKEWAVQRTVLEGNIEESVKLYPDLERIDPDERRLLISSYPSRTRGIARFLFRRILSLYRRNGLPCEGFAGRHLK